MYGIYIFFYYLILRFAVIQKKMESFPKLQAIAKERKEISKKMIRMKGTKLD